jgi:hypothetical protein
MKKILVFCLLACLIFTLKAYSEDELNPVEINEQDISGINTEPEKKFGLSEAKRRKIFQEAVEAKIKSFSVAEKKQPIPGIINPADYPSLTEKQIEKRVKLQNTLYAAYKNKLARKYKITQEQLDEIVSEGYRNAWSTSTAP